MHASRCRSVCIGLHRASRCRALLWHLPALASRCKPPLWHWHRDASPVSSISVQDAALCVFWSPARPASAFDTPPCTPSHACQGLKPSRLFDRMLAGDAGSWTIQLVHLELAWNPPFFGASAILGPLPCLAAGLVYLAHAGDVGMGGAGGSGTPCVGCW